MSSQTTDDLVEQLRWTVHQYNGDVEEFERVRLNQIANGLVAVRPWLAVGRNHGTCEGGIQREERTDDDPIVIEDHTAAILSDLVVGRRIVAFERDPESASAEYMAEFRKDIADFVTREAVDACVSHGVFERLPVPGVNYHAFCDPSGGSSDSMTLGVAHREGKSAVLDALREVKPPFSPDTVVAEFAALLKT